jgi:hypothetical protein
MVRQRQFDEPGSWLARAVDKPRRALKPKFFWVAFRQRMERGIEYGELNPRPPTASYCKARIREMLLKFRPRHRKQMRVEMREAYEDVRNRRRASAAA